MQDNSKKNDNSQQPEKPRMTKPVTGQFKKHKKQLGSMMKQSRSAQKKADK